MEVGLVQSVIFALVDDGALALRANVLHCSRKSSEYLDVRGGQRVVVVEVVPHADLFQKLIGAAGPGRRRGKWLTLIRAWTSQRARGTQLVVVLSISAFQRAVPMRTLPCRQ